MNHDIQRTQPFESCFLPGRNLSMMMVFRTAKEPKETSSSCPNWKTLAEGGESSSITQWSVCCKKRVVAKLTGFQYQVRNKFPKNH
jgi:hypothetical protein